jgi:hypothetical protein
MRAFLLVLPILLACDPSDPCDPGQEEKLGTCKPSANPSKPDDLGDAESPAEGMDAGVESPGEMIRGDAAEPPDLCLEDPYITYNKSCTEDSDCRCAANVCAPTLNRCAILNCMKGEHPCPKGSKCIDISAFSPNPDVTSMCR